MPLLEQARAHCQAALKLRPGNTTSRQCCNYALLALAQIHLARGDHARLATAADDLARSGYEPANDAYNAACFLCRCVTLADKDARLDMARRKELTTGYADRALALLRQAVARGYKDAAP